MKITFDILHILGIRKDKIKRIHWALGAHAFSIMLFFIFLAMLLGMLLFYKYVILVETKKQEITEKAIKFEYNTYQQVLNDWQVKNQIFQETPNKVYLNPFSITSGNSTILKN